MKHGVKPTREQRKLLEKNHLDTYDYLVVKNLDDACHFQSISKKDIIICYRSQKGVFSADGNPIPTI